MTKYQIELVGLFNSTLYSKYTNTVFINATSPEDALLRAAAQDWDEESGWEWNDDYDQGPSEFECLEGVMEILEEGVNLDRDKVGKGIIFLGDFSIPQRDLEFQQKIINSIKEGHNSHSLLICKLGSNNREKINEQLLRLLDDNIVRISDGVLNV